MKMSMDVADASLPLLANSTKREQARPGVTANLGRRMRWVGLSLVALLALVVALQLALTNIWWTGLAVGEDAPIFYARDLQGKAVRLSDYVGRPIMLTFWSPECTACREELETLQAIADAPGAGLALLTVVSHPGAANVQAFVEENGLTFPVLMDEQSTVTDLFKVHGVPFTYLIDPQGKVERKVIGAGAPGELHNQLAAWLRTCNVGVVCQE